MLFELLILLVSIFLIFNLFIVFSLQNFFRKPSPISQELKLSVIVAAKNEEKNISQLIQALRLQDYPTDNFEVIIIDDNSNDNTFITAENLAKKFPNFFVYKADVKNYPAKKGALDFGISKAKYPHILITDADCKPGVSWLKTFSAKFAESFDIVFGPVPFDQADSLTDKISCYENLRSSILVFAASEFNFAYSASARSLGFRKSAFEKIGGYSNTMVTLSGDDDLLLQQAVKHKLKIGTVNNIDAYVYSSSKENFQAYLNQKARHTKTSVHYLPSRQLLLGIWHSLNIGFLFLPLLLAIDYLLLLPFAIKMITDFFVSMMFQKKFGYSFTLFEKIRLQIFYEFLIIINFVNAQLRKDKW